MIGLGLAALVSIATFAAHLFVGTREVRAPLMASDIAEAPKQTLWLSCHVSSMLLGILALGFVWAWFDESAREAGIMSALGAGGCFAWALAHRSDSGLSLGEFPQAIALGLIWVFALLGLVLDI